MTKPEQKLIEISKLMVNPENPRFEPVANQTKAIELMLEKKEDEIKNLAKDIIHNGMNPVESLMVVSKEGKYLPLDGNRRVVALTLLNNPNKTSNQDLREFFNKMKDTYSKQIPNRVSCTVFENEDDAHHWIELKHTGKNKGVGVDPWTSEQRQRFLQSSSRSVLVFDLADKYGIDRKDVDATNLERLMSTSHVCNKVGISFAKGELTKKKSESEIKNNLKEVFAKMSENTFKVREIYSKGDREMWIDNILGKETSTKTKTSSIKEDIKESIKESTKSLPKSTNRKHLIPKDVELVIKQNKINNIFRELRDDLVLDGSKKATPNAAGVLFRVFLEASLYHYLQKKGITIQPRSNITQMIDKVTNYMEKESIASSNQLKNIRITSSKSKDILHIDRFHEYVHNSTIHPESDSLKAKWDNLQEFFEILWNDINKKGK